MRTGPLRTRRRPLPLIAAVGAGALLALESAVNGMLGESVRPVPAAAFSDLLSLVVTVAAARFLPQMRSAFRLVRAAVRARRLRPWHCLGGMAGGCMVLTQALATAPLGPALYTLALVAGQTLAGVLVDHLGLGPGGTRRATPRRVLGGALAVTAVAIPATQAPEASGLWLALLPFLAGAGLSWQMAVNGRVDEAVGNPYPSVALSFLTGAVILLAALAIDVGAAGIPQRWPGEIWQYGGGVLGALFVLSAVLIVRRTGVLAAGLGMITGQVLGSLALEPLFHTGAGGTPHAAVLGTVVLLGSVVLATPAGSGAPATPGESGARATPGERGVGEAPSASGRNASVPDLTDVPGVEHPPVPSPAHEPPTSTPA